MNLAKQNNIHNSSNSSSPLFFFAGSDNDSSHDGGSHDGGSHDCGGSFGEIAEEAAVAVGIDENAPYIGVFLLNKRLISRLTYT